MHRLVALLIAVAACSAPTNPRSNDGGSSDAGSNDAGTTAVTYRFAGPSATVTFSAGANASSELAATSTYPATSTFSFIGASAGGSIVIAEAFDGALGGPEDVSPPVPAAGSTQSMTTNPMLYFSFHNPGPVALGVDSASLSFSTDASSIFGTFLSADVSCELDLFDLSAKTWKAGTVVPFSEGTTSFALDLGVRAFPPGQTVGAITCD